MLLEILIFINQINWFYTLFNKFVKQYLKFIVKWIIWMTCRIHMPSNKIIILIDKFKMDFRMRLYEVDIKSKRRRKMKRKSEYFTKYQDNDKKYELLVKNKLPGHWANTSIAFKWIDFIDILIAQLEIEYIKIRCDTFFSYWFWNNNMATLNLVTNQNLCWSFSEFGCDSKDL